jgi:hypothetical protein
MVKKSVKKKVSKKKVSKGVSKKPVKASSQKIAKKKIQNKTGSMRVTKNKLRLVTKDLLLFVILTLISYILKTVSGSEIYIDFFDITTFVLGSIAVAFLIVLLVLLFLRALRK